MTTFFKDVVKFIYCAQYISDAQKGIFILEWEDWVKPRFFYSEYDGKDGNILDAIRSINNHKHQKQVNYYVSKGDIMNSVIVYFDIKHEGKRYQVSFHSFNKKLKEMVGKGRKTRWNNRLDSRDQIATLYGISKL